MEDFFSSLRKLLPPPNAMEMRIVPRYLGIINLDIYLDWTIWEVGLPIRARLIYSILAVHTKRFDLCQFHLQTLGGAIAGATNCQSTCPSQGETVKRSIPSTKDATKVPFPSCTKMKILSKKHLQTHTIFIPAGAVHLDWDKGTGHWCLQFVESIHFRFHRPSAIGGKKDDMMKWWELLAKMSVDVFFFCFLGGGFGLDDCFWIGISLCNCMQHVYLYIIIYIYITHILLHIISYGTCTIWRWGISIAMLVRQKY